MPTKSLTQEALDRGVYKLHPKHGLRFQLPGTFSEPNQAPDGLKTGQPLDTHRRASGLSRYKYSVI